MTFALVLLLVGALFTALAVIGWRHRSEELVSMLEAGILKVTGQEPLPLTRFDRWLQLFQLTAMGVFGPVLVVFGVLLLLLEIGMIS